ncbi:MAG: hypothetical protein WKF45_07305 [Ilumatobacteraceae bacterium]
MIDGNCECLVGIGDAHRTGEQPVEQRPHGVLRRAGGTRSHVWPDGLAAGDVDLDR